jgi:hypothetical protein
MPNTMARPIVLMLDSPSLDIRHQFRELWNKLLWIPFHLTIPKVACSSQEERGIDLNIIDSKMIEKQELIEKK